jgi:hypothetical protein
MKGNFIMKNKIWMFVFFLMAGLLLSACQPIAPVEDGFTYGEETIVESVEVVLLESFPVQARVIIKGNLPDGCTALDGINVERQGQNFDLTLVTRRQTGDIACTEALVPFEEVVELDSENLEAGIYSVIAQNQEATFRLDVEDDPPQMGEKPDLAYGTDAVVEAMSLDMMKTFPVQISVTLEGYLPDGCTEIHQVRSSLDNQTFTIDIITQRPAGDVACIMVIVPFTESIYLDVKDLPAGDYTVRHGEFTETFTLDVDNVNQ